MKLKHIDFESNSIFQDAREVKTKNSKTFTTYFFPAGDGLLQLVHDWVLYLRNERLWGNDDPLFPKTEVGQGNTHRLSGGEYQVKSTGALLHPFEQYLKMRLRRLAYNTSIRIALEIRWWDGVKRSAITLKSLSHGDKTWGMKQY